MKGGLDSYTVPITMIRETGNKTVMHTVESKGLPLWETALLFPAALVWAIRRFAFFARPTAITLRDRRRERLSMVLFVSPVLYAGVLLGLNYLVL
jgi:hypothetical protein